MISYDFNVFCYCRQAKEHLKNPKMRKSNRLLQESSDKDPVLIGIIGCGRLGTHLAHSLLTFGMVNTEDIKISTRRPETLCRYYGLDYMNM